MCLSHVTSPTVLCKGRGALGELLFSEPTVSVRRKKYENKPPTKRVTSWCFVFIQAAAKPGQMERQTLGLVQINHSRNKAHTCPWGKKPPFFGTKALGWRRKAWQTLLGCCTPAMMEKEEAAAPCSSQISRPADSRTPKEQDYSGTDGTNTPEYLANPALRFPSPRAQMLMWRRSPKQAISPPLAFPTVSGSAEHFSFFSLVSHIGGISE